MKFNFENEQKEKIRNPDLPPLDTESSLDRLSDNWSPLGYLQHEASYQEYVKLIVLDEFGYETGKIVEGKIDKIVELGKPITFNEGEIRTKPLRAVGYSFTAHKYFLRTEDGLYKIQYDFSI